ncbi:MAG TPA: hypothetical protein DEG70_04035, partial [Chloroflexi bacterium]|nr:hypothetical protein [Chloroflexota bacterium]
CERNAAFTVRQAAMTPIIAIGDVAVEKIADDAFVVRAMVANEGYLPTYGAEMARRIEAAKPVEVAISGAEPIIGKAKQSIGHLQGRSAARGMMFSFGGAKVDNERLLEWLVRGNGEVT